MLRSALFILVRAAFDSQFIPCMKGIMLVPETSKDLRPEEEQNLYINWVSHINLELDFTHINKHSLHYLLICITISCRVIAFYVGLESLH